MKNITTTKPGPSYPATKLAEEQGSVLVISLLIMVVLAMLGAIASNMSITEMQSSANEKRYNQEFYVADGAWQEVPMFLSDSIKKGIEPANINFTPINTTIKQSNGIDYKLNATLLGNSSCGSNCEVFRYQVDSTTLDPADNTKERQKLRVVLAAKFTNTGYGN